MNLLNLVLLFILFAGDLLAKKNFYDVLGVSKGATKKEIKKAFKVLSKKYHPDKVPGKEDQFIEVSRAYEVLSDDEKRRIYDNYGEEALNNNGGGGGFQDPFDMFSRFGFGGFGNQRNPTFSFLSGQTDRKGPRIDIDLRVTLEELFNGAYFDIDINKQIICPSCRGSGADKPEDVHDCSSCQGSGRKIVRQMIAPGMYQQMQATCDVCNGSGKTIKSKCKKCNGKKVKRGSHEAMIIIEKGMYDGQNVLLEGEGDQGPDISPGDIVCKVQTADHPLFTRVLDNLYMKQTITLKQALLGFEKEISHLDGSNITIQRTRPTQNGFVHVLTGQGMPKHDFTGERGNLYVEFRVVIPENLLDKEQKGTIGIFEFKIVIESLFHVSPSRVEL